MLAQKWQISDKEIRVAFTDFPYNAKVDFFPIPDKNLQIDHVQKLTDDSSPARFVIPITSKVTGPAVLRGVVVLTKADGSRTGWDVGNVQAPTAPSGATCCAT